MKKKITLVVALALVLVVGVFGTLAWLTDTTQTVTNTFTVGNVDITLAETGATTDNNGNQAKSFKMVPGVEIDKDPKVTVVNGSEDCWLFVKLTEGIGTVTVNGVTKTFDDFITYAVADGWTQVGTETNGVSVFGRKVLATDTTKTFDVIGYYAGSTFVPNKVMVDGANVTKDMMDALQTAGENAYPTLTVQAYAIQVQGFNDSAKSPAENMAAAWAEVSKAG